MPEVSDLFEDFLLGQRVVTSGKVRCQEMWASQEGESIKR